MLDFLCAVARHQNIFFMSRPLLRDPIDLVAELAVAASCDAVVIYNVRGFSEMVRFGIRVLTPAEFLRELELSR